MSASFLLFLPIRTSLFPVSFSGALFLDIVLVSYLHLLHLLVPIFVFPRINLQVVRTSGSCWPINPLFDDACVLLSTPTGDFGKSEDLLLEEDLTWNLSYRHRFRLQLPLSALYRRVITWQSASVSCVSGTLVRSSTSVVMSNSRIRAFSKSINMQYYHYYQIGFYK